MPASRNRSRGAAPSLGALLTVIAAGLVLGGAGALTFAADAKPAAKTAAVPAKAAPAAKPVATAKAGAVKVDPKTAKTVAAPAKPTLAQPIAQLDDHITYQYNTLGRRDPFNPLLGGEFVGADEGGDAPVEVGGMTVVGIVWGAEDKFALVEDARGNSLILRQGDKVMGGHVESLKRDAVIVNITGEDGQSQSVAVPLTKKGDKNANR